VPAKSCCSVPYIEDNRRDVQQDSTDDLANGAVGLRSRAEPAMLGQRLRTERERQEIGLRTLAKRVGVSASLISQVERGKVMPSVGTLYAIVRELGLSMDELFGDEDSARRSGSPCPVQRRGDRKGLELANGVHWERLTPAADPRIEFHYAVYEVGAESCPPDSLMRHSGKECGYILGGRLGITIGYESYELGPGDSVSFLSSLPHRLWNPGDEVTTAIWLVVDRDGDPRLLTD
jgi:transcriptional regulator with XRE-family HTH domain